MCTAFASYKRAFFFRNDADRSQSVLAFFAVKKSVTTDKRQNVCCFDYSGGDFSLFYKEALPTASTEFEALRSSGMAADWKRPRSDQ